MAEFILRPISQAGPLGGLLDTWPGSKPNICGTVAGADMIRGAIVTASSGVKTYHSVTARAAPCASLRTRFSISTEHLCWTRPPSVLPLGAHDKRMELHDYMVI
jgi:hypothetical protein